MDRDEILRKLADYIESGEHEATMARMESELRETVALAGFDPESSPGPELVSKLTECFMYEDLEGGKRPVRLAQAIALGMGLDVEPWTCGCGGCPEDGRI